ncbi:MAG TPA: hypothetical protein PKW90_17905, partial [Myxococcota bacterium]|nr:hypothetical protein [Myxococcota bacterium]
LAEAGKAGKEEEEDAESEEGPAEEASTTDITSEEEVTSDSEVTSESEVSSEEPDDLRERARSRANAWARRAVVAAGLVKKSRKNDDALDSAARNLVPHQNIKLPGDLYLVRWGGTRKGAGTFYTRPQLTHPTVRRTLEPLLFEEGRIRPPEAILSLKICDPAMGSGSFLVAALRVLTDAVIEALHHHSRVHRSGDLLRLSCDLIPAENQAITEDRLPGIVRRAVVEHCLYGVDLDPLAVELARVALWVETMDRRLPFTFLDHKLRCGNALVGCWFDRFRDYPLLAWNRQSPDEKWRGVHHPADFWSAALKNRRSEVASEQAQLLSGQERLSFAATADAELRAAIERLRALYRQLRAIPLSRPDARAVMWRDRIQADPALTQVRSAFDTWTALWFWPLDQLSVAPGPRSLAQPDEAAQHIVQETAARLHFFHWELEFPDVYTTPEAGFDAVVGNPPWEIQKPSSKEFFTDLDPLYRGYGKQEALRRQTELFAADPQVEQRWLAYLGDFKDRGNFVRNAAEPFG